MALSDSLATSLSPLLRTLFPYGSTQRVFLGPLRGMRFRMSQGMGLSYAFPIADPFNFALFCKLIKPGMVVYDLGANCGQMSLLFSKLVGPSGKVIAFEPFEQAYTAFTQNIDLNGLSNVTPFQLAVSNVKGVQSLETSENLATQSKLLGAEPTSAHRNPRLVQVMTTALDLEAIPPPSFIKIDVEGAGALVLEGAQKLLTQHAPIIYMELHGPSEQKGVNDFLISAGFSVETLDGHPVRDALAQWNSPLLCRKK